MKPALRLFAVIAGMLGVAPASAMTLEERQALDLGEYRVTDPSAGYFDVSSRKAFLDVTSDPILKKEIQRVRPGVPCADAMAMEPFSGGTAMPMYYEDNESWKQEVSSFHDFEDAISALAAAELVSANDENGECVIKALDRWAQDDAFLAFNIKTSGLQTWFQTESTLFAIAFAYSVVRDQVGGMEAEKQRIEQWLGAAARTHLAYQGGPGTCCNNHFYRRAVYAAMIGSLTGDEELFRFGVSAVYSAVSDAAPDGALPREMERGDRAAHYQNYATMYLVHIAQIAKRQGYDLYSITKDGKSLDTIISYALSVNENPADVAVHSGIARQKLGYLKDQQFFTWLELAAQRPQHRDRVLKKLSAMRPLYNRSLGGFATLYFMQP
jgi:poly(beta-D-mannuronate) lyase